MLSFSFGDVRWRQGAETKILTREGNFSSFLGSIYNPSFLGSSVVLKDIRV